MQMQIEKTFMERRCINSQVTEIGFQEKGSKEALLDGTDDRWTEAMEKSKLCQQGGKKFKGEKWWALSCSEFLLQIVKGKVD